MLQSTSSIETRDSWVVASVALVVMMMAFGAAWITAVALKDIAAEVNGTRSVPALASALAWLGSGTGGIIMGRVADRIGAPMDKVYVNLHRYGNISAASVAIALDEAAREGRFQRGDLILLVVFGSGLTWASCVIQW